MNVACHVLGLVLLLTGMLRLSSGAESTPWVATANEEWKAADQGEIEVVPGSALDLSSVFPPPREAGADGFSMVNAKGDLVFTNKPETVVRFRCVSATPNRGTVPTAAMLTNEECDRYADQLVRGGFNACRPHFLDLALMHGSAEDLVMNPERLDRWDYFTAALKKRGVYLYIDAMTAPSSYYAVSDPWSKEANAKNLSTRLYYDETARAHWREGVKRFFEHVNPYTGVALKDEPQVLVVQLRNESGLNFKMYFPNSVTPGITEAFRSWLKQRYGTTENLKKAWTRPDGDAQLSFLKAGQTLETVAWPRFDGRGPDSRDLQAFFTDIERETTAWMTKAIREIGVKVPLIEYNVGYSLQTSLARDMMPVVDNHAYHDHPTKYITEGSSINGTSSTQGGVTYFQFMAGTRQLGRPFFCSEWGHVFWNPWRHEAGLTLPAYASLQGWQFVTQFAHPVHLSSRSPIKSFAIYNDPPLRAAEYMSAFFYRRGDVRESPHTIEVVIDPAALPEKVSLQDALPASISRLSLLARLGVRVAEWPGAAKRGVYQADWSLVPNEGEKVSTRDGVQEILEGGKSAGSDFNRWVTQLREKSILSADNATDAARGIYESDTRQILLDEMQRQIRVVTSKSLGVSLPQGGPEMKLGPVQVRNLGVDATFFVGSLTAQPVPESSRLLLVVGTDALNTGMTFTDERKLKLVSLGTFPALLRVAKVQFSLTHQQANRLKMWALSANGQRREEIPLTVSGQTVSALIDTAILTNGPTPYFELQEQVAEK
ncbi:MAG: hypothetical protein B9S32_00075 [Verrucomicrobia bacterium Tous-C9LFEB]|nr:MAG: hypothetical protein B9S32_00075 [Verrucomicrobia bacterium Tous-C9LFEB]